MIACGMPSGHQWPETPEPGCCAASAYRGPQACTCWTAVYPAVQAPVSEQAHRADARPRAQMCGDCAYKPGSPERTGDERAAAHQEDLDKLVSTATPFWCHQGLARPLHYVHPCGMTTPASDLEFHPPIIDGRPYKVDGTPGDLCAGWAARVAHEVLPDRCRTPA